MLGVVVAQPESAVFEAVAQYPISPGAGRSSHAFRSYVRHRLRCCRNAWVMLTANKLWNTDVVALGLMNGACGKVVGVVPVIASSEHSGLAIVVNFPSYTGKPIFPLIDASEKWVPVGIEDIEVLARAS